MSEPALSRAHSPGRIQEQDASGVGDHESPAGIADGSTRSDDRQSLSLEIDAAVFIETANHRSVHEPDPVPIMIRRETRRG